MRNLKDYGLHHVGFVVRDLKKTVARFEELYQIKDFSIYPFSPTRTWSYGEEVFGYRLLIAMIFLGNGSAIEIIQPLEGKGVHSDFVEAGNSGMHHIAFSVDDFDYWREYFLEKEAKFVFESETEDDVNGYRRCFYAEDQEAGMIYEIKENPYHRK